MLERFQFYKKESAPIKDIALKTLLLMLRVWATVSRTQIEIFPRPYVAFIINSLHLAI
jgi:hypothetical protein